MPYPCIASQGVHVPPEGGHLIHACHTRLAYSHAPPSVQPVGLCVLAGQTNTGECKAGENPDVAVPLHGGKIWSDGPRRVVYQKPGRTSRLSRDPGSTPRLECGEGTTGARYSIIAHANTAVAAAEAGIHSFWTKAQWPFQRMMLVVAPWYNDDRTSHCRGYILWLRLQRLDIMNLMWT